MPKKKNRTCYMCGNPATSKEHVPPACLFPEEKDIKTSAFRNNLITVPSCDLHNSKKSNDDEFLMACIAGIVGNNIVGFFHFRTKVQRALERKGNSLDLIMKDQIFDNFTAADGAKSPVIIGRPNMERLRSCFLHIASGLYYHKFAKVFKGECNIIMDFVTYQDSKTESFKLLCRKLFQLDIENLNSEGNNQDIFNYSFLEPDQFGLIALRLTFYGGTNVFIAFKGEDDQEPYDLISASINSGIETIIHFDDGSKLEFNK